VAIIFALSLPLIVGGAGLGTEVSYWYYKKLRLQAEADAAAYAAALERRSGSTLTVATTTATSTAESNGFQSDVGSIAVNSPPLNGTHKVSNAVEVILSEPVERYFTALFSDSTVTEGGRAVALYETADDACILALNPSASSSILFSGNSALTL